MADTGEDREIERRVNAHQAEVIRESNQLEQRSKAGQSQNGARRKKSQRSPSTNPISRSQTDTTAPPNS